MKKLFPNYSKHSHCMLGIAIIESGTINIDFNSCPSEILSQNQLAIFNPDTVHCSKNTGDGEASNYYVIYLNIDWCKSIQNKIFGNDTDFIPVNINILKEQKIYNNFRSLFKQIINETKVKSYEKHLAEFITNIFIKYCNINYRDKNNEQHNKLANIIKIYITDNLDKNLSINDVSTYTGYNSAYINRVFKNIFGLTIHAFIINQKINKAKKMLIENKDLDLSDIANEVGFYEQSHFSKTFKKIFAVNPSIYRI
ncbi:MAG: helix-turn-helix transcriptional regulator [Arcobacteraceae bacterium]|nr:helix-turn-helix transcriptional regulator [Arcobacteraceae bacterium]